MEAKKSAEAETWGVSGAVGEDTLNGAQAGGSGLPRPAHGLRLAWGQWEVLNSLKQGSA